MGIGVQRDGSGKAGRNVAYLALFAANLTLAFIMLPYAPAISDVFTPLTGHVVGIGLSAAVALVFARRAMAIMAAGLAVTLAVHAWLGVGPRLGTTPVHAATPRTTLDFPTAGLTVLTLNTWDAVDNVEAMVSYFRTQPADVLVLAEVGPPKRAMLEALRPAYPYQADCAEEWTCSMAILSRVPFEAAGAVRYSKPMPAFVWARFAGAMTVIGTHVFRPSRNPWIHARETAAVADFVRRIEGPVMLVGDFNMSPWSYSYRRLLSQTGLSAPHFLTPTWPAWPVVLPQVALDHILISPDLQFVASHAGPSLGSDHLPMWAHVRRQPAQVERKRTAPRNGGSRLAAAASHLDRQLLADLGGEHLRTGDLSRR